MSSFEASRLSIWLRRVVYTQDEEIDCEELSLSIEVAVEAAAQGADVRAALPAIAAHLEQCPDCQEWFETLVELSQQTPNP
jgi:hypothetical protein